MPIQFNCPGCGKRLQTSTIEGEKKVSCPGCNRVFTVAMSAAGLPVVAPSALAAVLSGSFSRPGGSISKDDLAKAFAVLPPVAPTPQRLAPKSIAPEMVVAPRPAMPHPPPSVATISAPTSASPVVSTLPPISPAPFVRKENTPPSPSIGKSNPEPRRSKKRRLTLAVLAATAIAGLAVAFVFRENVLSLVDPDARLERQALAELAAGPAIVPARLDTSKLVRLLPAPVEEIAVGGNGRYLLLYHPQTAKISQFDVSQTKIVHTYETPGDNLRIAAGLSKLVVVSPAARKIQRWDLASKQLEQTATLPDGCAADSVSMGSASEGPVILACADRGKGNHRFLSLTTLSPLKMKPGEAFNGFGGKVRVAADGSVIGIWSPMHEPAGLQAYLIEGDVLAGRYQHAGVGHVVPGPDGNILYTAFGLFANDTLPLDKSQNRLGDLSPHFTVPAVHGNYAVSITFPRPNETSSSANSAGVAIHLADQAKPLTVLRGIDVGEAVNPLAPPMAPLTGPDMDRRFLFVPEAKAFIVLPQTNDELWLYRVDLEETLHVASRPSARAVRGSTYCCPLTVKGSRGGVTFSLASAPPGMRVTKAGTLLWPIPSDARGGTEDVRVAIADASGQEATHTFQIAIVP